MSIELPALPYSRDALSPHISEETIDYHYGKHHQSYVDKLNTAIEGTDYAQQSLLEIIRSSDGSLFNNAAQVWNHTFYWNSLSPSGGGEPNGSLAKAIDKKFGSFANFKDQFSASARGNFGSGWTWLIKNSNGVLEIVNTSNAKTVVCDPSVIPLITCDVWEHAYYVDYRNARADYIENFWNIVNWEFAQENFTN